MRMEVFEPDLCTVVGLWQGRKVFILTVWLVVLPCIAAVPSLLRAWTGKYVKVSEDGVFTCVVCGSELFQTDKKYESGSGECPHLPSYMHSSYCCL